METGKLQVKIFVEPSAGLGLEAFIPVFHRWIREHVLDELLLDVANYAHVPRGPGVVLIGHHSDYAMDVGDGRLGLLCNRKRAGNAPWPAQVADAFYRSVLAARLIEREQSLGGRFSFRTDQWLFRINDRLHGPNDDHTLARIKPALDQVCHTMFAGPSYRLERIAGSRDLFTVAIRNPEGPSLETVFARLSAPSGPPPPA
jgi:hypothetical protein